MAKSKPFLFETDIRGAVLQYVITKCNRDWPKNAWVRISQEWVINIYLYADPIPNAHVEFRAAVYPIIDGKTVIEMAIDFDFTQFCRRVDND